MNDESKTSERNWSGLILIIAIALIALGLFWKAVPSGEQQAHQGRIVEDFTLPDTTGRLVKLSEYVRGRPFVISFGTTTCPYCERQNSAFNELQANLGDQVAILEVNVGETAEAVAEHVTKTKRKITTLVDEDGSIFTRYGSEAVPVTLIADKSARILQIGNYITEAQLTAKIKPALAKTP